MWPFKEKKEQQFETVLQRLVAAQGGGLDAVTPENCLRSPTVQALHTAITNRISSTPVHVYQTKEVDGKATKEKMPTHPVALLLKAPNAYQTNVNYLADMASCLVRYNKYIAIKGVGGTGPIRTLDPVKPNEVTIERDDNFKVTFKRVNQEWPSEKVHYIRGPAKDFVNGESIVQNISTAIEMEIAIEDFGSAFFENGAVPLQVFKATQGMSFKTPEDEKTFVDDFQEKFSGKKRWRALFLPKGVESDTNGVQVDNEKAQFLETRKMYQTVIAGAWNVPPHMVGNLESAHYNNVEQQDKDFTISVIMPYFMATEAAMERDLLTEEDRKNGIVIRFNMDATLRASYQERQTGLATQVQHGVISPNEWREIEGRNPRKDGDQYYQSANLKEEGAEEIDPNAPPQPEPE